MYETVEELLKDISHHNITNTKIIVNIEAPKHVLEKIENTIKHIYDLVQNNILMSYEEFRDEIFIQFPGSRMHIPVLNTKHINDEMMKELPEIQDFIDCYKSNCSILLYTVPKISDKFDTVGSAINTFFNNNMEYIADIAITCILHEILGGSIPRTSQIYYQRYV